MIKSLRKKWIYITLITTVLIVFTRITPVKAAANGQLKVHFIDVGDADCILIQQGNKSMLIDAGNNLDEDVIKKYLLNLGIDRFDIIVGTHVDEDHIGSMDAIINDFEIDKIYMPQSDTTTKYLEDVMEAVRKKGLQVTAPVSEEVFNLGEAVCTILAPVSMGYEKLNNYSIVIKLQYGNTSFLFTGDAESVSEREMMRRGFDLSADVLKLGHHGSISSTSDEFLDRVNPQYAVIMLGRNNNYRHPHKRIMEKLKVKKIKVYRTDEKGTVVAESDGEKIIFNKEPGSYNYGK
jgi:competence protein ComEC